MQVRLTNAGRGASSPPFKHCVKRFHKRKTLPLLIALNFGLNSTVVGANSPSFSQRLESLIAGNWGEYVTVTNSGSPVEPGSLSKDEAFAITESLKKPAPYVAEEVEFDERFLNSSLKLDLKKYSKTGWVAPGYYSTEIRVNGNIMFTSQVLFRSSEQGSAATPCLDYSQIFKSGIISKLKSKDDLCHDIKSLAEGITYSYDSGEARLDVSVPQEYLRKSQLGISDRALWDSGVDTLYSQYSLTTATNKSVGTQENMSNFLRLDSGANISDWQWRNSLTVNKSSGVITSNILNNYLRTDIDSIKGEFKAGNFFTSGVLLDTFNIRGLNLSSVDEMLPDDELGYAPAIRGIAESNAIVTISRNGQQLYKTQVAPGPFSITDMNAGGFSGSLLVTITESDGRVRSFLTPYNSVPQMIRKDRLRYSVSAGQYVSPNTPSYTPLISQTTLQYGVLSNLTGYVGSAISSSYKSFIGGTALNTFFGGVGLDITSASTTLQNSINLIGNRLRLNYSKIIGPTGTNMNVVFAKTSNANFYNTNDAMNLLGGYQPIAQNILSPTGAQIPNPQTFITSNAKSSLAVSLTQDFSEYGTLTLSGIAGQFWTGGTNSSFSANYNKNFKDFTLGLGATQQLASSSQPGSTSYNLNITIPFGSSLRINSSNSTTPYGVNNQVSIGGNFGERNQYSYNVGGQNIAGASSAGGGVNASIGAGARMDYGIFGINTNQGQNYSTTSFSANGGVVLHSGGITFGQKVNDTVSLVEAKDATGARVNGQSGPAIDSNGYAVIDSMRPYRSNSLYINPKDLPDNVELTSTSQIVTPRIGAITKSTFATITGRGIVFNIKSDKGAIPFGATVQNALGVDFGAVGQGGQAFLRGIAPEGKLSVIWSNNADGNCSFSYKLPPPNPDLPFDTVNISCG